MFFSLLQISHLTPILTFEFIFKSLILTINLLVLILYPNYLYKFIFLLVIEISTYSVIIIIYINFFSISPSILFFISGVSNSNT
jgi:hypothetical protein